MFVPKSIVALVFLFSIQFAFAQNEQYARDSSKIASLLTTGIVLNYQADIPDSTAHVSFAQVKCFDARLDTSCIGVVGQKNRVSILPSLPVGLSVYLDIALKNYFTANEASLSVFIKRLRIATYDSVSKIVKGNDVTYLVSAEIESYYTISNDLYPAFRIDTSYYMSVTDIEDMAELLKPLTDAVLSRCFKINTGKVLKRNRYSANDIIKRYEERKQTAFNEGFPLPGLYASIDEFKKNSPSVTGLEVKYKNGRLVFLNNGSLNVKEYFIFSDGRRLWINTPEGFMPLVRNNDRYEYIGYAKRIYRSQNNFNIPAIVGPLNQPQNMAALGYTIISNQLRRETEKPRTVHFLDIETGEIY